jgi:hypothetical protein
MMKLPIFFALLLIPALLLYPQAASVSPYQVKAVFLYNFTGFTQWPERKLANNTEPFVIGIWGENPFDSYLKEAVQNEKKDNHPIVIKTLKDTTELSRCHILFINKPRTAQVKDAIMRTRGLGILTVGEAAEFTQLGGMVRFYTENSKVRLQINVDAVKESNLVISSKLLRLADIVNTGTP